MLSFGKSATTRELISVSRFGENPPIWQNFKVLCNLWWLVSIRQTFEPNFATLMLLWQFFVLAKYVQILKKWSSHLVTLLLADPVVHLLRTVWPYWAIYWTLGTFLKPLATINLPKSPTILGNFCKGVKIYTFSSEIIFGQLLYTFGDIFLVTLTF